MEYYIGETFYPSKAEAIEAAVEGQRIQEYRGPFLQRILYSDGEEIWVRNNWMVKFWKIAGL